MIFCKNCKNYMKIKEINTHNIRNISYTCHQCNYTEPTNQFIIFQKSYKQVNKKDWITNPQFSIKDSTLPRKSTKCPECKKINDNVYYQNNDLTITLVCNNCKKLWIYS